jgi:DNA-binding NarL/FixJ family response regulator
MKNTDRIGRAESIGVLRGMQIRVYVPEGARYYAGFRCLVGSEPERSDRPGDKRVALMTADSKRSNRGKRRPGRVRLVILDRDLVTCRSLAHAFNPYDDIEVVGYATSPDEIEAEDADYHVVLVNRHVPELSVVRLAARLTDAGSSTRVVVTGLEESEWLVLRYVVAGVDGFVFEDADVPTLADAVRAAAGGEASVTPRMAYVIMKRLAALYSRYKTSGLDASLLTKLSQREKETLELIGEGLSNREIADALDIRIGTVKSHVHNLLRKLQVSDRREAAGYLLLEQEIDGPSESVDPEGRPETR